MTNPADMADPYPIDSATLPPDLVAERQRILRLAADADRRADRGRLRRRALLPAAVASGVLAGTGLIGAWARATSPAPAAKSTGQAAASARAAAATTASEQAFLEQLRHALDADRQAIAALPQAAASSLSAASAAPAAPGASPGTTGAVPVGATTAPIAALPPISIPAVSAPPTVHATTGASGLG